MQTRNIRQLKLSTGRAVESFGASPIATHCKMCLRLLASWGRFGSFFGMDVAALGPRTVEALSGGAIGGAFERTGGVFGRVPESARTAAEAAVSAAEAAGSAAEAARSVG